MKNDISSAYLVHVVDLPTTVS